MVNVKCPFQSKTKSGIIAAGSIGCTLVATCDDLLDEANRAQCNHETPRHDLDCELVSSAGGGGSRAGCRARPRSGVVVGGSRGSRSRERGIVDRGGSGDTYGRSAILNREIITGDGSAKVGGGDVGGEVEELHTRIRGWSGRSGEICGLSIDEEDVAVRASALRWAV